MKNAFEDRMNEAYRKANSSLPWSKVDRIIFDLYIAKMISKEEKIELVRANNRLRDVWDEIVRERTEKESGRRKSLRSL